MEEIAPGLWHWKALRERIGAEVSSYYLARERVLIDPMIPPEGLGWFDAHGHPDHLLLTNRHHDRDAWKLCDAFDCKVHCIRNGLHELEGRGPVEPFDFVELKKGIHSDALGRPIKKAPKGSRPSTHNLEASLPGKLFNPAKAGLDWPGVDRPT